MAQNIVPAFRSDSYPINLTTVVAEVVAAVAEAVVVAVVAAAVVAAVAVARRTRTRAPPHGGRVRPRRAAHGRPLRPAAAALVAARQHRARPPLP